MSPPRPIPFSTRALTLMKPAHQYHQVHRPYGLLACPMCRHESMIVRSYGREHQPRTYYAACENDACEGSCEGPRRPTVRDAVDAFNAPLLAFSHAVLTGHRGANPSNCA